MLHMPSPMLLASSVVAGQILWEVDHSQTAYEFYWPVPIGVTKISMVAIGAGGRGGNTSSDSYSGGGGGLAYANNIAVGPASPVLVRLDPYNGCYVLVNSETKIHATAGSMYTAGQCLVGTGYPGGYPTSISISNSYYYAIGGAGAGGYTSAGQSSYYTSLPIRGGGGSSPFGGTDGGGAGVAPNNSGLNYGGGQGASDYGGDFGTSGKGCVRIIWGDGRSFPNTNTANV